MREELCAARNYVTNRHIVLKKGMSLSLDSMGHFIAVLPRWKVMPNNQNPISFLDGPIQSPKNHENSKWWKGKVRIPPHI
ncbi:hypothetical protein Patl1_26414 [Pistacia atlantica]|uniref:Uncharacterized protein n=1 Tax=Pistacia atlantica TaxID=434234 RepID=A0ACC1AZS6_9ROSI|nr:hypothetical protein Patl1_26414 [Pistacia atlantica]